MKPFYATKLAILIAVLFAFNLGANAQTATFTYNGGVGTFVVPGGVTMVSVDMQGANGGNDYFGTSYGTIGYGGRVQCLMAVTSGVTYYIYVGGIGTNSTCYCTYNGGYNGGGQGSGYGGSGGGGTDIRNSASGGSYTNRLVVAGGAGGMGCYYSPDNGGNGGGLIGANGQCGDGLYFAGQGGTQSAGGSGGTCCSGGTGAFGTGGNYGCCYAGGGGGGWYGGGAGYEEAGGAGGSSYTNPAVVPASSVIHTQGYNSVTTVTGGNGICYINIPPPGGSITPSCLSFGNVVVGTSSAVQSVSLNFFNLTGSPITITPPSDFQVSLTGLSGSFSASPVTLTYTGGGTTATVYVEFVPSLYSSYSGTNITFSGGGIPGVQNVCVSGTGTFPCTGTPTAGTAAVAPTSGAAATPFTLSLSGGSSGGGITYQWQSSVYSAFGFTNILGANAATYTFTGITTNTYYRCVLTCPGSGLTATTGAVEATVALPPAACIPTCGECSYGYECSDNMAIASSSHPMILTGVLGTTLTDNNACVSAGYQDFTGSINSCIVNMGSTPPIAIGENTNSYPMYYQVWIDFNNDGTFQTSESVGGGSFSGVQGTGTLTIPTTGVTPGYYRIRMTTVYSSPSYPSIPSCTTTSVSYAETRDYGIHVQGPGCVGAPPAGTITPDVTAACNTFTSNMLYNPASGDIHSGYSYLWQSSPDGSTWSAIPADTTVLATVSVSGPMYYNVLVTCNNSGLSNNSASQYLNLLTVPSVITGPTPVCIPAPSVMTSSPSGGIWSSNNTSVATVGLGSGIVTGVTSGLATIKYTLSDGCSASLPVTVSTAPVAISGASGVCAGASTSAFYDGSSGGLWSSSSISLATVGSLSGVANGLLPGTVNIVYTLPSGCKTSVPLSVNSAPAAIGGPSNVCIGSTITVTDVTPGGTWVSSTFNASVGATTGYVSGLLVGPTNIIYTLPTGCSASAPVTINSLPNAISGTSSTPNACVGTATPLSETTPGGAWSSDNTSIATVDPVSGNVTGVAAGAANIIYTVGSTGCTAAIPVTINPLPPVNTVTVTNGGYYCVGGSGVHIGLNGSVPGYNYDLWTGGTDLVTLAGASSALDFGVYNTSGLYTVVATNPLTFCTDNMTGSATVYPASPLPNAYTVMGGGVNCYGGPGVDVNMSGSDLGVMYQLWNGSLPSGAPIPGTGGSTLDFGLQPAVGTYSVSAVNATSGCSNYMAGSATVATNPALNIYPVTGGGNFCLGATTGADVQLYNSDPGISYQLFVGSTPLGIMSGSGTALDFGPQTMTGIYTVVASVTTGGLTCTQNMSGSATVGTLPLPTVYTVTGGGNYCAGTTGTHVGLSFSATGTNYQLYNDMTLVTTVGGSFSGLDFGLVTDTGTYTVMAVNAAGCSAAMTGSTFVGINPLPTVYNVSPGNSYCAGGTGVDVNLSSSDNTILYQLMNGTTNVGVPIPGSSGFPVDFGLESNAGTYSVEAKDPATGCTNMMNGVSVIAVTPLPIPYNVTGGGNYCFGGAGAAITLNNSQGGVTYTLALGGVAIPGVSIAGTGGMLSLGSYTGTGVYTVVGMNGGSCSSSMNGSVTVGVNPLPAVYAVTGGGNYCSGGSGQHVGIALSNTGISYQLLIGGVATGLPDMGTGFTYDFGLKTAAGNYQVLATNATTGCSDTMSGSANIAISAAPMPYTVINGGPYCAGGSGVDVSLSSSDFGVNYHLRIGTASGGSAYGTGSVLSFGSETVPGVYTVIATDTATGCTANMLSSTSVIVNPVPNIYTVTGGGNYCAGATTGVPVGVTSSNSGINYILYVSSGAVDSATTTGGAVTFSPQTVAGVYTVVGINESTGCWSSMTGSATVGITPTVTPVVLITTGMGDSVCSGNMVTFTANPTNGGTTPVYSWSVNGGPRGSSTGSYSYIPANGDVVAVTMMSNADCPLPATVANSQAISVLSVATPSVTINSTAGAGNSVCAGNSVTVSPNPTNGGSAPSYSWRVNGFPAATSGTYTYNPLPGDIVFCVMTSNYPCVTARTVNSNNIPFSVNSAITPVFSINADPGVSIGKGQNVYFTINVAASNDSASIQWEVNGGSVLSTSDYFQSSTLQNNDVVSCKITSFPGDCPSVSTTHNVVMSVSDLAVANTTGAPRDITVIPNPNKGTFTVKGSLGVTVDQKVTLEVTNAIGQVVYTGQVMVTGGVINQEVQLSGNIANGMYILNVHTDSGNSVFHFVVEQ